MDKKRPFFTLMPFLLGLMVGWLSMPATDVVKVTACGMGFEHLQPWRATSEDGLVTRSAHAVCARLRSAFHGLWGHPLRGPALATAVLVAATYVWFDAGYPGVMLAVPLAAAPGTLERRAQLLREAEQFRNTDGVFADDRARAAFDAKMAEVEALDEQVRRADVAPPVVNPLDPGAPTSTSEQIAARQAAETDRQSGVEAERVRTGGIMSAVRNAGFAASFAEKLIKDGVTLERAQAMVLEELGKRDAGGPRPGGVNLRQNWGRVEFGADPVEHVRTGIANALLHRVAPNHFKLDENGRQYAYASLIDMAKYCMQARGVRTTGMSKMDVAATALGLSMRGGMHTSSDFAEILADTANKTLRRAYDEAPQTYQAISRRTTLPDFKPVKRLQLGEAPQLIQVREHGEFQRGTIGEGKEQYQLATYGRVFAITRKAIVNDDTEAFSRITMLFGRSARDLESDLVWGQITSNPVMGDGVTLFHANHANLAGAGAAIAVPTIGAGRAAMRMQKGLDGKIKLNIVPKTLVVPVAKETDADQFVSTNLLASQPGSVNPFAGRLQVLAEPRLDDVSAISWYLGASPDQIDMVEYAYLEGEEGPVIETRVGFDVDGVEVKCRHDFAAKVIDWRGFYKNPGA